MEKVFPAVPKGTKRIYFLDNLRAFVIALVVVLHGAITYMSYAPKWWYVVDPQHSLVFTALVLLIDVPVMMVMFFVAAYFLPPSLAKRDQGTFLKDKFVRIGAPWIIGVLLLTPPTAYLTYYSRHLHIGFVRFWTTVFWAAANFQQSVYWFLGVLLLFFVAFSIVYRRSRWLRPVSPRVSHPTWKTFCVFWGITTLGMFSMSEFGLTDDWFTGWFILVFQPMRVPLYVSYFVLGIVAYSTGWFTEQGYMPHLTRWFALWVLSGLLYLFTKLGIIHVAGLSAFFRNAASSALFNAFCLSSLMTGVAAFQRHFSGAGPLQRSLALNSYGIYYIHPLILYPLAYLFVSVTCPLFLKAAIVIGLGFVLSWAASALALRKAPILRRIF